MTVDAVGGVWRYAMDLGSSLRDAGMQVTFQGFGPPPDEEKRREARRIGDLLWADAPLDWTTLDESDLAVIPSLLRRVVEERRVDLVQLNVPSQAFGLELPVPVVAMAHSCVVTWFRAVRGLPPPPPMQWHENRTRVGLRCADAVVAPSSSHADMVAAAYGALDGLHVVHNAVHPLSVDHPKESYVFAAGRWWDEGKNGAVLDAAAALAGPPVVMAGATRGPDGQYIDIRHARALGEISNIDARRHLARAAIFASPSIYEPFGLTVLEAASAGAALVLADNPTYRELWDGCGLFCDPASPEEFAAAINSVASDPVLRADLGRQALARSRAFTLSRQLKAMRQVFAAAAASAVARQRSSNKAMAS
ncbi:glycosyltransferase family 4 protein [Microbaculum marinum]